MSLPAAVEESLQNLPVSLQETAGNFCAEFLARPESTGISDVLLAQLPRLAACSPFIARILLRYPGWLAALSDGQAPAAISDAECSERIELAVAACETREQLKQILRELRQQEMLRLAWRDLQGLDELDTTLQGLSSLADALITAALNWLGPRHAERHGQPLDAQGKPMGLVVLGMGKLGGNELNFSSDIDLIFAFADTGQTSGPRPLSHEEYFRGLAQQLVTVLNEHTEHGFVFRVDTRLRPFGDSGPLVMHFAAMENYYLTHGREWERYALIKARPVAGDIPAGVALLENLRPFVYRRYLDYSVYDSLREMKAMIERETVRKGLQDNIKLGRGGIREIEFMAQVYQLIRGGQDAELQDRGLRRVLGILAERELLPPTVVEALDAAYVFLRRLENRLQAYADQQTHDLPNDGQKQAAIALAMGKPDWSALLEDIRQVRDSVNTHFQRIFGQADAAEADQQPSELQRLWRGLL
ncbi:MAG: bifunctional [glutamate--ammonia ligase]-adenylyl-L-tyrosine phosphorylase/[glutamate--ammonia-ligase] adenylyltransferase, partial [Nevskiales bacterium]